MLLGALGLFAVTYTRDTSRTDISPELPSQSIVAQNSGKDSNEPNALLKLSLEEVLRTSNTLSLTDLIIMDYTRTKDDTRLRAYAASFEKRSSTCRDAFKLYEKIGDKDGMQRAAKRYFIQRSFLDVGEKLVKKSGLKLTPDLYNERGDYLLQDGHYIGAFEAYQQAGNTDGMKRSAFKLEERGRLDDAFESYLTLGDNESACRIAKRRFITTSFPECVAEMFKKLNIPINRELWNERGDHQLELKWFDDALEAYQKAGNANGINSVLQRAAERLQ